MEKRNRINFPKKIELIVHVGLMSNRRECAYKNTHLHKHHIYCCHNVSIFHDAK